jgi:hypothetical protein
MPASVRSEVVRRHGRGGAKHGLVEICLAQFRIPPSENVPERHRIDEGSEIPKRHAVVAPSKAPSSRLGWPVASLKAIGRCGRECDEGRPIAFSAQMQHGIARFDSQQGVPKCPSRAVRFARWGPQGPSEGPIAASMGLVS